jgi:Arc/MetJ-type ribon-helix-helix transcriptional regulator
MVIEVNFTEQQEAWISKEMATGKYSSVDELIDRIIEARIIEEKLQNKIEPTPSVQSRRISR